MTLSEKIEASVARLHGDKERFRQYLNPVAIVNRMCDVAKYDGERKNREPWGIIKEMTSHGSVVSSAIYQVYRDAEPEPDLFPVFEILDRMHRSGWSIEIQNNRFFIFDEGANMRASGATFRDLCTNIVLLGL